MLIHWAVTFLGNLAGSLFIVAIVFGCKYPIRPAVAFHIDVANNKIEQLKTGTYSQQNHSNQQ
jgi:formate/nitrite transporter FocA (FNT family)